MLKADARVAYSHGLVTSTFVLYHFLNSSNISFVEFYSGVVLLKLNKILLQYLYYYSNINALISCYER